MVTVITSHVVVTDHGTPLTIYDGMGNQITDLDPALVKFITVCGTPFADTINLSQVDRSNFPFLENVTIDGGDGNDTICASNVVAPHLNDDNNLQSLLLGDINGDGQVDASDIMKMMTALTDLRSYQANFLGYGLSDADLLYVADTNRDGVVNNADLQGELDLLKAKASNLPAGRQFHPWWNWRRHDYRR